MSDAKVTPSDTAAAWAILEASANQTIESDVAAIAEAIAAARLEGRKEGLAAAAAKCDEVSHRYMTDVAEAAALECFSEVLRIDPSTIGAEK